MLARRAANPAVWTARARRDPTVSYVRDRIRLGPGAPDAPDLAPADTGRALPTTKLRVELDLPSGAVWTHGPDDAPDRVTGPAGEYCRVFVQRMPRSEAHGLVATGSGAREALLVARAFL